MAINLAWPRAEVFGTDWYLRFFPELFLAGPCWSGHWPTRSSRRRSARAAAELDPAPLVAEARRVITDHDDPGGRLLVARVRAGRELRLTALDDGANCSTLLFAARHPVDRMNIPDTLKAQMSARIRPPMVLMCDRGAALASVTGSSLDWHDCLSGHSLDAARVRVRAVVLRRRPQRVAALGPRRVPLASCASTAAGRPTCTPA